MANFPNPFSPFFGGKPESFFGRQAVLSRFDRALEVRGSEDRSLFVTGTRGCGKTALVMRLSARAEEAGWITINLSADNALRNLLHETEARLGTLRESGASLSAGIPGLRLELATRSRGERRFEIEDVESAFLDLCESARHGVFVSIDEVQKTSLKEISTICNAFQMASSRGFDVILVAAGLPYSYDRIIQHDGCAYMRRSSHEQLGLFGRDEVREGFMRAFERVPYLTVREDALGELVQASSGQPYLMQLLGYHLVEYINGKTESYRYAAKRADVAVIVPVALETYARRALKPLVDALTSIQSSYLTAMAQAMGEGTYAGTKDVADILRMRPENLTSPRKALLDKGIIAAPERGKVRFAIPYLRAYLRGDLVIGEKDDLLDEWGV